MRVTSEIQSLIERGALFVANHSGGKDSQAMLIKLREIVPAHQLLVVHASLGEIEWHGALELAEGQAADAGLPFVVARAKKTFFDMVEHRFETRPEVPSWPSAATRQCTSDLKRDPIAKEMRAYAKAHGFALVVNCMGIRAAESVSRSKKQPFQLNKRETVAGRTVYQWFPIFELSTAEVFAIIRAAGQEPHPAYAAGNERLSCVFCVMASGRDLLHGAKARPELFQRYVELEERTGYTMHMSRKSLTELVAEAEALAELPLAA
jgi:3'-phosphoadenosine 5'-phosphosulfate sulfotransferase (PAPS reductase)/FAD synthetase